MLGSRAFVGSSRTISGTFGISALNSATLRFIPRRQLRQRFVERHIELLGQSIRLSRDLSPRSSARNRISRRPVIVS